MISASPYESRALIETPKPDSAAFSEPSVVIVTAMTALCRLGDTARDQPYFILGVVMREDPVSEVERRRERAAVDHPVCFHLYHEILTAIGRLIKRKCSYLRVDPDTGQAGNPWSSHAIRARKRQQHCSRHPIFEIKGQSIARAHVWGHMQLVAEWGKEYNGLQKSPASSKN